MVAKIGAVAENILFICCCIAKKRRKENAPFCELLFLVMPNFFDVNVNIQRNLKV